MPAFPAPVPISIVLLLVLVPATGIAQDAIDFTLPSTHVVNASKAYDSTYGTADVWGGIEFIDHGSGVYMRMPTNAPAGAKLAFFQDTITGALFRNNTLVLPINDASGPVASLALMTGDLVSSDGTYSGAVTGIEVDSKALDRDGMKVTVVLYLDDWPGLSRYRVSISEDESVRKAISEKAAKGRPDEVVKLMVDVEGDSIGYLIVRMMAPGIDGNVTAYQYREGTVVQLGCKEIRSNDSIVYETISTGEGTFAFVGPFVEGSIARADLRSVMIFSGVLFIVLIAVDAITIQFLKWASKK